MAFINMIRSQGLVCLAGLALALALALPFQAQASPQDYVNAHNAARAQVGVGPVTWDEGIAAFARSYVSRLSDCKLVHSGDKRYGENLAYGSPDLSPAGAVGLWVSEKADYDYGSNTCAANKVCGHYTQVVWRDSVRIGCGEARCNNNFGKGTVISCNYAPPGNYVGQKPY